MTELQEKIFALRLRGYSYKDIQKELGCSKSTISYNLNNTTKTKAQQWKDENKTKDIIANKIWKFKTKKCNSKEYIRLPKYYSMRVLHKIYRFLQQDLDTGRKLMNDFSVSKILDLIEENPYCYLSGRKILVDDTDKWSLDHIHPSSRGGDNTLENCGITTSEVNQAKNNLTVDEFIELCKDVLQYNGYSVTKN